MDNRHKADIVFSASFFSGNSKALFLMLQETELASRTCWLSQTSEEYETLAALGLPAAVWSVEHEHQHTWRMLQKAKLIIGTNTTFVLDNQDAFDILTANATKLNLWHGSPWKNIGEQALLRHSVFSSYIAFDKFLQNSYYFLLPHPDDAFKMRKILPNAKFIQAIEPKWISLIAPKDQPKYIELNSGKYESDISEIKKELKTFRVMWAPTYRETYGTWTPSIVQKFIDESQKRGIELVIKPHHWDNFLPQVLGEISAAYLDPRADIYPLLSDFDFVVTDYSSLLLELKRIGFPTAAYSFDFAHYENRHGLISDVISTEDTLITDDLDQLFTEILKSEKNLSISDELISIKETWFKIIYRLSC